MDTKACNLTIDEIVELIIAHGKEMDEDNLEYHLERMNYLNKRLKAFKEIEEKPKAIEEPVAQGWPTDG